MDMLPVVSQMGVLFFLVALGFVGAKCHVLDRNSNEMLSRVVIDLILPCSILYSAISGEHLLSNVQTLLLMAVACIIAILLILLAWLLVKIFRIPADQAGVSKFMIIFTNATFVGFPVVRVIFGSSAVFFVAVFNMVFMLLAYTYGVALIGSREQKTHFSWNMLLTPLVISSVLAFTLYLANFKAPAFLIDALGFVDQMTSPLSMLTIGCALAFAPMKNILRAWRVYVMLLIRMLLFPIAFYYLMGLVIDNTLILGVATIIVAMPAPASTTMFCAKYDGDQTLASSSVFISTLLSIGTIPLLCRILFV